MARATTLPAIYRPMMGRPSMKAGRCLVCGRNSPLNDHHVVRRSAGRMFDEAGRELGKPTVTLCGFGNNLKDAGGRPYCHGLAHSGMLHFRWAEPKGGWQGDDALRTDFSAFGGGHWEYLLTDGPCDYLTALGMKGWRKL